MPALTSHTDLSVTIEELTFKTPLMNASGAFNPHLFNQLYPIKDAMGALITKTVTPEPRPGNPQQRTVELDGVGMLNSIGLQNPGLDYALNHDFAEWAQYETPLIVSISATEPEGFETMATAILNHPNGHLVHGLELNLSCPNVAKGGVDFGSSPSLVNQSVASACNVFKKPVFAKLTPNVGNMLPIAEAAINAGATGITAINTLLGTSIDLKTQKPILPRVSGGYSGPGIKPVALHHVYQLHKNFPDNPIIGVGGISTAQDVLEFILAGASIVQVGTICFRHPKIFETIINDINAYLEETQTASLSSLIGKAHQ